MTITEDRPGTDAPEAEIDEAVSLLASALHPVANVSQ